MPTTKNMLDTIPPLVVALLEKTNEAYSSEELTLHLGISNSACTGLLYYMKETGVLDLRRLGVWFYFLKDQYTEPEIKEIIERAYLRKNKIKSIRR